MGAYTRPAQFQVMFQNCSQKYRIDIPSMGANVNKVEELTDRL